MTLKQWNGLKRILERFRGVVINSYFQTQLSNGDFQTAIFRLARHRRNLLEFGFSQNQHVTYLVGNGWLVMCWLVMLTTLVIEK